MFWVTKCLMLLIHKCQSEDVGKAGKVSSERPVSQAEDLGGLLSGKGSR